MASTLLHFSADKMSINTINSGILSYNKSPQSGHALILMKMPLSFKNALHQSSWSRDLNDVQIGNIL